MNKIPELSVDFGPLYETLVAQIRSKVLETAITLKIFDKLAAPTTAESVAHALISHPGNTQLFLDSLAGMNLVEKKEGKYVNTPLSQTFLIEGRPTYIGGFLMDNMNWRLPALENMKRLILEGPPKGSRKKTGSDDMWAQMAINMANYHRSGMAQMVTGIVEQLPEFPSFKKMLDLGGGPGLIGISIAMAHPTMRGIIFDQPSVAAVAREFIKEFELTKRMEAVGGDYAKDPIGNEYDLVWASSTLNFFKNDLAPIIKKIYDALNPGGIFISLHDGLTNEMTKPEIMQLSWMTVGMLGMDLAFKQGFIAKAMLRVGFKSIRTLTLDTPFGPMDMDIAIK